LPAQARPGPAGQPQARRGVQLPRRRRGRGQAEPVVPERRDGRLPQRPEPPRLQRQQPAGQEHLRLRQLVLDVTGAMSDLTHFERLGLPRRFRLDLADLERSYLGHSRLVHPDYVGDAPPALQAAAALNEAYATLRDPFRRAEYLLQLEGGPSATEVKQPAP